MKEWKRRWWWCEQGEVRGSKVAVRSAEPGWCFSVCRALCFAAAAVGCSPPIRRRRSN
ncbi:hypothetical protein BKA81DRAFT_364960 [Phyllosticta paracitricarpa]